MNKAIETKLGPTIYHRINAIRMSEAERQVAIDAMQTAQLIVDGCEWVALKIQQLAELFGSKPSPQH